MKFFFNPHLNLTHQNLKSFPFITHSGKKNMAPFLYYFQQMTSVKLHQLTKFQCHQLQKGGDNKHSPTGWACGGKRGYKWLNQEQLLNTVTHGNALFTFAFLSVDESFSNQSHTLRLQSERLEHKNKSLVFVLNIQGRILYHDNSLERAKSAEKCCFPGTSRTGSGCLRSRISDPSLLGRLSRRSAPLKDVVEKVKRCPMLLPGAAGRRRVNRQQGRKVRAMSRIFPGWTWALSA